MSITSTKPSPEVQAIYRLLRADARMLEIDTETYIFCGKEHHRLSRKAYKGLYAKGWIEQAEQYPGSGIREFTATSRARESVAFIERLRTGFIQLELLPDLTPRPAAIQQPLSFDQDDAPAASQQEQKAEEEPAPTEPTEPAPEATSAEEEEKEEKEPERAATSTTAAAVVIPPACQVALFAPAEPTEPATNAEEEQPSEEAQSNQPQALAPEPSSVPTPEEEEEPASAPALNFLETVRIDRYSPENQRRIRRRMPHATYVATYKTWQENGYQVRRGEHGVSITFPRGGDQESGKKRFKARSVFDLSQCDPILADGEEEPEEAEARAPQEQPTRAEEHSRPTHQPQAKAPKPASVFQEMAKLLS